MTMIDEGSLEQLLASAAEVFEIPIDGAARIEAAAETLERRSRRAARHALEGGDRTARTRRSSRTPRVAAVAASVVVAAVIGVAAFGHLRSPGPTSAGLAQRAMSGLGLAFGPANHAAKSTAADGAASRSGQAAAQSLSPRNPGDAGQVAAAREAVTPQAGASSSFVAGPKIESTGSMNLTVSHLDTAVSALTSLVTGDGGYVAAEQTQSASPGVPASGTMTLQVPQASFSTLLGQVKRLGVSGSVSTKQVDVTGQYVDLQAQITAWKATQQQYLTIMTRAQSIGDILAVQQQINTIDSQLQQVEGELHLLDSQTSYGTLTVDLTEPGPKAAPAAKPPPAAPTGLAAAWGSARHGFADGVYWVVRQTGGLAFLILLAGLLFLLGRVGWRGLRRLAL